ncbi:hypothetical protein QAD02_012411 [Eretmocerus hayati]|uniref:Uncharacterized protein n=1 Tax=Eretmocerus hayati TaxID=131215 RepID=A0ACC2P270_9HYME|nr:hypothetical protein QAD02_012411 [Eretmocerus hayati]
MSIGPSALAGPNSVSLARASCCSTLDASQSSSVHQHVVKIKIEPGAAKLISSVRLNPDESGELGPVKINLQAGSQQQQDEPRFYYGSPLGGGMQLMASGQCSPSETLDSGTCSDLDATPPPPVIASKKLKTACKYVETNFMVIESSLIGDLSFGLEHLLLMSCTWALENVESI